MLTTQTFIYGAYARKSSESEDRQVQSIDRQIDDILEIQAKEDLTFYEEPIKESKSAFSLGREGFDKLVKLTEKGKINAWFCWHANRLSRNPMDAGMIIYLMDLGKLHHIRTPSRIYFNNPTDKMMLQIEFTMSKKDSDDKSLFVKSGLQKRYRNGLPNGRAPVGYLNNKSQDVGNRGWVIDNERFDKVKLLFKKFLKSNDSTHSLHNHAIDVCQLTTTINKTKSYDLISFTNIYFMLLNPIYAGFFYAKNTNGELCRYELSKEIPRMITEEEHFKIKQVLKERRSAVVRTHNTLYTGYIKSPANEYIGMDAKFQLICDCKFKFAYSNKTHCPNCKIEISKIKKPKYLEYTYYYNFRRKKFKKGSCKYISEDKITHFIAKKLKNEMHISKPLSNWAKKNLYLLKEEEIAKHSNTVKILESNQKELEVQKQRLLDLYTRGLIDLVKYENEVKKTEDRTKTINTEISNFKWFYEIEKAIDLHTEAHKIYENGTFGEKKELISQMGSNLIWDEENLYFKSPKWQIALFKELNSVNLKSEWFEPKNCKMNLINKGSNKKDTHFRASCLVGLTLLKKVRKQYIQHIKNNTFGKIC